MIEVFTAEGADQSVTSATRSMAKAAAAATRDLAGHGAGITAPDHEMSPPPSQRLRRCCEIAVVGWRLLPNPALPRPLPALIAMPPLNAVHPPAPHTATADRQNFPNPARSVPEIRFSRYSSVLR